ncbi:unnamed protein product [Schistosoma margrebowiei]|uniref:Uncharacterized protein n=1 Tax=Schistosoma margrebowiei TaxID=48269 RepID=A0A183LZP0_9TREM|nr:unnamed protein product [Schistosoma margrebowiei]
MLTTALNFLTDKRKRFHRSDTMPAFTNDSNFFKLTSDNQIIENDKHLIIDKESDNHNNNDDDNINNSNNDGITFTNIPKRDINHYQGEILMDKSINYQNELPSSTLKSYTHEKLFENNDTNDADEDDDDEGGDDNDNEYNTNLVNFPSLTLNDKYSIENIKIPYKQHLSVGNLDKYQFLDLETNLYRHGKNYLNNSINEIISRRLSHGYSLSNIQVLSDNTSLKSDVSSSVTFSKKTFHDIHHITKDKKTNHSSKYKKFESTKSLRYPSELKESHIFISNNSNKEQIIESTNKISGKSKVAKMRARAVAKVAKGKLKRSKSSAYMSRYFQEFNSNDNDNDNIRGRSSSTHRNSDINFKDNQFIQQLSDNKIYSSLVKNWIDKTPRLLIHVYADYPTGLTPGVSVRLLINMRTTVGEVIDTVVKQLLETADRKNFIITENNDSPSALNSFDFTRTNIKQNLENHLFCLIVSVGQLERCLPNTVRLALLRKPWRFGKLTIRLLSDLSKDIQHQIPLNTIESKNSCLSDQIVSPLLTVTFVKPNLKQANINSPPEILH